MTPDEDHNLNRDDDAASNDESGALWDATSPTSRDHDALEKSPESVSGANDDCGPDSSGSNSAPASPRQSPDDAGDAASSDEKPGLMDKYLSETEQSLATPIASGVLDADQAASDTADQAGDAHVAVKPDLDDVASVAEEVSHESTKLASDDSSAISPPAGEAAVQESTQQPSVQVADNVMPQPAGATIIRLADVHKSFGPLTVLDGVNLDVEQGKNTVIVGPSGTGKSVLLKHIVGLLSPDRGEVWFRDKRVDTLRETELVDIRMRFGFLFQMGALFDSMTVGQNICFPLTEHTKMPRTEQADRCARVLGMVGLSGIDNKMPAQLSGGQRKRVALARAIVLEPEVVLYDEPTTGLDPIRADVINELIVTLNRELGITSIVVTHDMVSARKIAHRMVMLYDGHIVADGDPDSFCNSDDDLVQRFVRGEADADDLQQIRSGFG